MAGCGPSGIGQTRFPADTRDDDEDNWDWTEEGEVQAPRPKIVPIKAHPSLNYYLAPGDVIVQCPYEPAHQVREARLTVHLTKCKRNYAALRLRNPRLPEMIPCRYNWQHHIPAPEYEEHVKRCPDGADVIRENAEVYGQGMPPAPAVPNPEVVEQPRNPANATFGFDDDTASTTSSYSYASSSTSSVASNVSTSSTIVSDTPWTQTAAEEDWEAELEANAAQGKFFSQRRLLESQHVYFMPSGMAPADRKLYRQRMVEQFAAGAAERERREQEQREQEERQQRAGKSTLNWDEFN